MVSHQPCPDLTSKRIDYPSYVSHSTIEHTFLSNENATLDQLSCFLGGFLYCTLLHSGVLPKGRSLVPGCGRGYDAIAFGNSGYDSIGLDLSPTGVVQAKALLAEQTEQLHGKVLETKVSCGEAKWTDARVDFLLGHTLLPSRVHK